MRRICKILQGTKLGGINTNRGRWSYIHSSQNLLDSRAPVKWLLYFSLTSLLLHFHSFPTPLIPSSATSSEATDCFGLRRITMFNGVDFLDKIVEGMKTSYSWSYWSIFFLICIVAAPMDLTIRKSLLILCTKQGLGIFLELFSMLPTHEEA